MGVLPPATALERVSKEAPKKIQVLLTVLQSIGSQKLLVDLFTFYRIQSHHVGFSPIENLRRIAIPQTRFRIGRFYSFLRVLLSFPGDLELLGL